MGNKNIVGHRIRIARVSHIPPLSQTDLLIRLQLGGLKLAQSTLSKIEHGDRTVSDSELLAIAKALDIHVGWLLGEPEPLTR